MQAQQTRIGILGGTFNPIHFAHLEMAQMAKNALRLEHVLLVVANDPPHKTVHEGVSAEKRYTMTMHAAAGKEGLAVSDIELRRQGKSYTIDTVLELQQQHPDAVFFVIVGSDMLLQLGTWHRAEELLKMVTFVSVPRDAYSTQDEIAAHKLRTQYGANITILHSPALPISSTLIRDRVFDAQPITGFLPQVAERYIYAEGLYLPPKIAALHTACKERLSERRFLHTMGVVETAVWLADRYDADAEKTRIAALLHDIGRSVEHDALLHAPAGEKIAKSEYNIHDEDILQAIRLHTTLRAEATVLDKVIYLADMIEPSRTYEGVEELRALAGKGLDAAVLHGLRLTIAHLQAKQIPVQEHSLRAVEVLEQAAGETGARR